MNRKYKIRYFYPDNGQFCVQFEGFEYGFNYTAPFRNGAYLNGQELDDYIQLLYPYTPEELEQICPTLSGAEYIESLVEVETFNPEQT